MARKKGQTTGVVINATMLRVIFQERGFDLPKFADAIGVQSQTVHNYLAKRRNPNKKVFKRICQVLEISPLLLTVASDQLSEIAKHQRIMRFYTREMLGLNEDPTYAEIAKIEEQLADAADGESAESEVKESDLTLSSQIKPFADPK